MPVFLPCLILLENELSGDREHMVLTCAGAAPGPFSVTAVSVINVEGKLLLELFRSICRVLNEGFWEHEVTGPWADVLSILCLYQVYGIFYATSFLDLYRNPKSLTTSLHNMTVIVNRDEQYLFLVSFLNETQKEFPFFKDVLSPEFLSSTWIWELDIWIPALVCVIGGKFLFFISIATTHPTIDPWLRLITETDKSKPFVIFHFLEFSLHTFICVPRQMEKDVWSISTCDSKRFETT